MNCSNNDCSSSGLDLVGLSSSLAILISKNTDLEDLGILAAFFTTLGDNLALIATSRSICEAKNSPEILEQTSNISDELFRDLDNKF